MAKKSILTGATPKIVIEANADLVVRGEDIQEVRVVSEKEPALSQNDEAVVIICDADCTVLVPKQAKITLNASGDVNVRDVEGTLEIDKVGGDVNLRNVKSASAHSVGGDLNFEESSGELLCEAVGGDLHAEEVRLLPTAHPLIVGGDAVVNIIPHEGDTYNITAGGDINCYLAPKSNATVNIVDSEGIRTLRVGNGGVSISLTAGGDTNIESEGDIATQSNLSSDIGKIIDNSFKSIGDRFRVFEKMFDNSERWREPFENKIQQRMEERIKRKMDRVQERIRRAQEHARRAEEHAIRKAERIRLKAEARERRAQGQSPISTNFNITMSASPTNSMLPTPPFPPRAANETQAGATKISDAERLTILQMVAEKKISLEQAEKLLAALEGESK
jgi:hypothetical protein